MVEETENKTKFIISEIQNRIQFGTMIAIFFSGLIYYFFNIYDVANANRVVLSYGIIVGLYLAIFCFFEFEKNKTNIKLLSWINGFALSEIFLFITPMIYLASIKVNLGLIKRVLFILSLYGLFLIPSVLLLILLAHFLIRLSKKSKN